MCALSLAISLPLRRVSGLTSAASWVLDGVVGLVTIVLGSWMALSVFVGTR